MYRWNYHCHKSNIVNTTLLTIKNESERESITSIFCVIFKVQHLPMLTYRITFDCKESCWSIVPSLVITYS